MTCEEQLDELRRASRYEKFKNLKPHHGGIMLNNMQRATVLECVPTDYEVADPNRRESRRWGIANR